MKIQALTTLKHTLADIYSPIEDDGKGRLISLGSAMITALYNVFITGFFYTAFLSMYGISITGVGIVYIIPYAANCFSLLSPSILRRFKKRKWILLGAKIYFYAMTIIATTLMPQFITDTDDRLTAFVILLFLAYAVYALFSPGLTTWFYNFYPEDSERRTRYIAFNQIFSSILSCGILIFSGILTDALKDSPMQSQLILIFRYAAFAMVLMDVFLQAKAKEYPYAEAPKLELRKVFTLPFRHKKFLACMIIMFVWNYISNLNNGLWSYHLLNHIGISYTLNNTISMLYTAMLIATSVFWQKLLHRCSWVKTFGIGCLLFTPTEFLMFILSPGYAWLWAITSLFQHFCSAGINLSYANILYLNLPDEESTAYISFNTIGCNLFALLGMTTGTWVSSITGDTPSAFLGLEVYSVQYTTLIRAFFLAAIGIVLIIFWKRFTPDHIVEETIRHNEHAKWLRKHRAELKKKQHI